MQISTESSMESSMESATESFWKGKSSICTTESPLYRLQVMSSSQLQLSSQRITELEQFIMNTFQPPIIINISKQSVTDIWCIALAKSDLKIIACIRFSEYGKYYRDKNGQHNGQHNNQINTEVIHLIDCFCISKEYRKKGLASKMLIMLREYTAGNNNSIFLKESAPVYSPYTFPTYSSYYRFASSSDIIRASPLGFPTSPSASPPISNIIELYPNTPLFNSIIKSYQMIYKNTFIITCNNSRYLYWKSSIIGTGEWLLMALKDSYQIHPINNRKIGWISGCIFSPTLSHEKHNEIFMLILYHIAKENIFGWFWIDSIFISGSDLCGNIWKIDGEFHWYLYGWNTKKQFNNQYVTKYGYLI